jgi:hypothetical protein
MDRVIADGGGRLGVDGHGNLAKSDFWDNF